MDIRTATKSRGASPGENSGPAPPKKDNTFGPRPVNLPGTRAVSRCTQCGTVLPPSPGEKCPKCGFELHSCKQCMYFDPGSRFECMQPVTERIAKKDTRNDCSFYEIRVTREKETSTPATARPNDARQAFEEPVQEVEAPARRSSPRALRPSSATLRFVLCVATARSQSQRSREQPQRRGGIMACGRS